VAIGALLRTKGVVLILTALISVQRYEPVVSNDILLSALPISSFCRHSPLLASQILTVPSGSGEKKLFSDLSKLNLTINTGHFDVGRVIPLLTAVLNNESVNLIWDKAYKVVTDSVPVNATAIRPSPYRLLSADTLDVQ
jgi:hypothetical protein